MMSEREPNEEDFFPQMTALEEIWQNQTYIPIKGWGSPYTGIAHYSDLIGDKAFSSNDNDFPDILPISG
jgi:hypothetical protein